MNKISEKYTVLNPELLVYCLPKGLNSFNSFSSVICSVKKKEIDMEISSFNLLDSKPFVDFLTVLENRYGVYDEPGFFVNQELSIGFDSIDQTLKQPIITKKRKKVRIPLKFKLFLNERKILIEKFDKKLLLKTRLLMVTKGGYLSQSFGVPAFVLRSYSSYYQKSYKSWFLMSCSYYGLLSYFNFITLTKKKIYEVDKQKFNFYDLKSELYSYIILLEKQWKRIEK